MMVKKMPITRVGTPPEDDATGGSYSPSIAEIMADVAARTPASKSPSRNRGRIS